MLVAVPVAAAIGVLMRFGLGQYEKSPLYKGHVGKAEDDAAQAALAPTKRSGDARFDRAAGL